MAEDIEKRIRVGRHRQSHKRFFNKEQMIMGIEVEKEHTDSIKVATEIAKDHLSEIKDYYSRLKIMEKDNFWQLIEHKDNKVMLGYKCPKCAKEEIYFHDGELLCSDKTCSFDMTLVEFISWYTELKHI